MALAGRQYSLKGPVPAAVVLEVAAARVAAVPEVVAARGVVPEVVDRVAALEVDQVAGPAGTLAGERVAVLVLAAAVREEALELAVVQARVLVLDPAWAPAVPVGAPAGAPAGGLAGVMAGGLGGVMAGDMVGGGTHIGATRILTMFHLQL